MFIAVSNGCTQRQSEKPAAGGRLNDRSDVGIMVDTFGRLFWKTFILVCAPKMGLMPTFLKIIHGININVISLMVSTSFLFV